MILLNQPWSYHERQLAAERQRDSVTRAALAFIWWATGLICGLGLVALLSGFGR